MQNWFNSERHGARALVACALILSALPLAAVKAQVLGSPNAPVIGMATMPPPSIDAEKALAPLSLTPRGALYAKKKHQEIVATTKEGRAVVVAFDWAGRIKSVTDANHRKEAAYGASMPTQAKLEVSARTAGFEPLGVVEVKRHHVVMRARNQQGEMLDLHVDFGATIYKQVWLR